MDFGQFKNREQATSMAVKKFYAADMHTALSTIRHQLGEDAIILGSRQLADGIEVSASADSAETEMASDSFASEYAASLGKREWRHKPLQESDAENAGIYSELGNIRSLLQHWMDDQAFRSCATRSPTHAKLWERFRKLGLEADQTSSLLRLVDTTTDLKAAWYQSLSELCSRLPTAEEDIVGQGGVFALLGASGVGKTTTLGKLATRAVLSHGADAVALVTTDHYRIAAHEQLRTLSKILHVNMYTVDEENSLSSVLDELEDKHLVLIDCAGLNPSSRQFQEQQHILQQAGNRCSNLLVMSASSQRQVQRAELRAYADFQPVAAIITKVDETSNLGGSLDAILEVGLPIAYTCHGQAIPEDIAVANPQHLVNTAVLISRRRSAADEELVAGFSRSGLSAMAHENAGMQAHRMRPENELVA
jgi:flagellar biosynthesis protein FlhF